MIVNIVRIYTGHDRTIMVLYTYSGVCPYKELQTFVSYSEDNGETLSNPHHIAPYANRMCSEKGLR